MKPSNYLKAFNHINSTNKHLYQLVGDCLLVEVIKDEEFKTKSGIILSTDLSKNQVNGLYADKPTFVRVLLVGEGYYDDEANKRFDGENDYPAPPPHPHIPLDSQPGDIVLVGRTSIKNFSVFGQLQYVGDTQIGLIRESDIQMRFFGDEQFDKFFNELNVKIENKND